MNKFIFNSWAKLRALKNGDEGQDLVEYALVVAMLAFGATAGMTGLASALNNVFTQVSTTLSNSIT